MEAGKSGIEAGVVDAVIVPNDASSNTPSTPAELMLIGELIQKAWRIYTMRFRKFVGMYLLVAASTLPVVLVYVVNTFNFSQINSGVAMIVLGFLGLIWFCCFLYVILVVQVSLYILAGNLSRDFSIKEAFLEGRKHIWKFVIINAVIGVTVLLWTFLFIIPGIIMSIAYSLALWAYFYEGFEGGSALKRSRELIKGNWWAVFGRTVGLNILLYIVMSVPFIVFSNGVAKDIWTDILNIVMGLASPFFIICGSLVFQNLKAIKGESKLVK